MTLIQEFNEYVIEFLVFDNPYVIITCVESTKNIIECLTNSISSHVTIGI